MEDLGNLMLAAGSDDFGYMLDISTIGKYALDPNTNWANVVAGSNDDAGVSSTLLLRLFRCS